MISSGSLAVIGRVVKTHGVEGEMTLEIRPDVDLAAVRCVVVDIDGINVPFFITAVRARRTGQCIAAIDGIVSDREASALVGREVYGLRDDPAIVEALRGEDDGDGEFLALEDLVGFRIVDTDGTVVGIITDIDDSTENVLFNVERPDMTEVHIPAAEPLIEGVDTEEKLLIMNLPTGLF